MDRGILGEAVLVNLGVDYGRDHGFAMKIVDQVERNVEHALHKDRGPSHDARREDYSPRPRKR